MNDKVTRKSTPNARQSPLFATNLLLLFLIVVSIIGIFTDIITEVSEPRTNSGNMDVRDDTIAVEASLPKDLYVEAVTKSQQWKYKTVTQGTDEWYNFFYEDSVGLGTERWELVAVTPDYSLIFKQPVGSP